MNEVWKFILAPGINEISMPHGAKILYTAEQYGEAVLYALVNPNRIRTVRKVMVVGTGHQFDPGSSVSVGLVKMENGLLMFHVFAWSEPAVTRVG